MTPETRPGDALPDLSDMIEPTADELAAWGATLGKHKLELNPRRYADAEVRDLFARLAITRSGVERLLILGKLSELDWVADKPEKARAKPKAADDKPIVSFSQTLIEERKKHAREEEYRRQTIGIWECLDEIKPEQVDWLWPGRIPLGRVSLIMGRQGDGKSTLVSWLASKISTGGTWPDCPKRVEPGSVLLLNAEESAAQDIRPRMDAFGYGRGKIHILKGVQRVNASTAGFSLGHDCHALEEACDRFGDVRLIIVDPIGSYFRGVAKYDTEVRETLQPLFDLADARKCSIVLVAHPTKNSEQDVLDRVSGSGAFTQMVRMAWYLSVDPRDKRRRLISLMKGNLHGATRHGLSLRLNARTRQIEWDPRPVKMLAGDVDRIIQAQAREARAQAGEIKARKKTSGAKRMLLSLLGAGECSLSASLEKGQLLGHSGSTMRRAVNELIASKLIEKFARGDEGRIWLRLTTTDVATAPEMDPEMGSPAVEGAALAALIVGSTRCTDASVDGAALAALIVGSTRCTDASVDERQISAAATE